MQTKNVYYSEQPDRVIVTERGDKAIVEFPCNVTAIENEARTDFLAETVYFLETMPTPNLKNRVEAEYDAWLEAAKTPAPQAVNLTDVVDAINALTEIVLGGGM